MKNFIGVCYWKAEVQNEMTYFSIFYFAVTCVQQHRKTEIYVTWVKLHLSVHLSRTALAQCSTEHPLLHVSIEPK